MSQGEARELTEEEQRLADAVAAEALDLPEEERADYVRSRCVDHKPVFDEVNSLLDYMTKADRQNLLEGQPALPLPDDEEGASEYPRPEIPGFQIERELGHGGMGIVFEAVQSSLGRTVALKVLPANLAFNPKAVERFKREARAAAKLHNPHILPVYEFGEHKGIYYYTMELIEGVSLAERIKKTKAAEPRQESSRQGASATVDFSYIADVVQQIAALALALHSAHEAGLLHRDLKPSNIIIGKDGLYRLIDFGLVQERGAGTLTLTGELLGTVAYMAPEQLTGQAVDPRTDVYSLGATLYEALTLDPPFEGASDHELQSKILFDEPERPTRKNLRLSRDLDTVIMKALEKNPKRRYNTAREFAGDLQRFLRYEPIKARPVGVMTKSIRWTRRNPTKTVILCAMLLAILSSAGFLISRKMVRGQAVRECIAQAETFLDEGDFTGAMEAVGRAQGLDPSSFAVLSVRTRIEEEAKKAEQRRAALEAEAARCEAGEKAKAYEKEREAIGALRDAIEKERRTIYSQYVPIERRASLVGMEEDLKRREVAAERLLQEVREALELAIRMETPWGGQSPETEAVFASFFFDRWEEALLSKDAVREEVFRASVKSWDKTGIYNDALLGRGTLLVAVTPSDAEIHLFRYASYETVRNDPPVIPRLVPVPTSGTGYVKEGAWAEGFYPGDLCLKINEVKAGSPAWESGLRRGDLVIRLNREPCGWGLFVQEVVPDSPAAIQGIKPLARIVSLDGERVDCLFDWINAGVNKAWEEEHSHQLLIGSALIEAPCRDRHERASDAMTRLFGISPASALDLLQGSASLDMTLDCLHQGETITSSIAEGQEWGATCEVTAYPLILSSKNRIQGEVPITADPGSYLLFVGREGFEDQRYPIVVSRGGAASAHVELLVEGSTPPGFVYIPPGPFIYGGDLEAFNAGPVQRVELEGFFIAEKEVNNEEWFAFLNDEETLKIIEQNEANNLPTYMYIPRQPNGPLARKSKEGKWMPSYGVGRTPVLGVSRYEIERYLDWRNLKARENKEPWSYALPDDMEWEKAARGVDGRWYPWGDRFDFFLAVSSHNKNTLLFSVPCGFEPRDRSPFGVADMAGSRIEWTLKEEPPLGSGIHSLRGGSWCNVTGLFSRCATRDTKPTMMTTSDSGFRLKAILAE
ncbi:MAG: protein kinase [Planctomycetota bacterium]